MTIELPAEKTSIEAIAKKHAEIFAVAERAWAPVSNLLKAGQDLSGMGHLYIRWVVLAYYAKQLRSFRSILLLLEHGLVPEAQKILRPMLETRLQLDFIGKAEDIAKTARHYLVWELANDDKLAKILEFDKNPESAESFNNLQKFLDEEKKRLSEDEWKRFVKYGPSLLHAEALAHKLSLKDWYDTVYRKSCGPIHAFNILTYARPDEKRLSVFLAPMDKGLAITLIAAIGLLLSTGITVDQILKLGQGDALKLLDTELAGQFKAAQTAEK